MPDRLHQACRESGCKNRTNARSGYCADHEYQNSAQGSRKAYDNSRRNDPVHRLYTLARWRKFERIMLNRNPVCQRIGPDGKQCRNAATLGHHLVSPRQRLDLFLVYDNVLALCANCHPPTEGTPDWIVDRDYVPSVIAPPTVA